MVVPQRYMSAFVGEDVQLPIGAPERSVDNSAFREGPAEKVEAICIAWLDQNAVLDHTCFRLDGFGDLAQALAPAEWRLQIVEAVAYRAERGLVVPLVGRDGTGRTPNHSRRLGERHHLPALQQPDKAGLVVPGQATIRRVRVV